MSTSFQGRGHAGDESHHYYRQGTAPTAPDLLQVGDLWSDTASSLLKRCTSVSPVTFVSVEGGSSAHDLFSATHGDVDDTDTPLDGDVLVYDSAAGRWKAETSEAGVSFVIDGGGSTIATGIKGDLELPFAGEITAVRLLADQAGSIQVDIWKDTFASFPPTDADSITASAVPAISSGDRYEDTTLTGWTKTFSKGDILRFTVDSATGILRCTISLSVKKT
jgi:hypothetical protein